MALEYIFKVFLYVAVILILIGIMWGFKERIPFCIFGCEDPGKKCEVATEGSTEQYFDKEQIDKYCTLCWEKNMMGGCEKSVLCYAVDSAYGVNVNAISDLAHCEFSCSGNAHTIFVNYDYLRQKVIITC
ncbi:hypothetical protein A3K63_03805 [Candidatus Micrarchaeota archaeon RBG_16_49_10]|nr:MAG: hypothetical protein A3K63_03805 [Candidatus Micrarchaeota archaeon RBG_16_49_10]